jgi:hypothetical protein
MLIFRTQATASNPQGSLGEIDVIPFQAERFALSQAEGKGHGPPCTITPLPYCHEKALYLLNRIRFDLLFGKARCLGERGRISPKVAPTHSLV